MITVLNVMMHYNMTVKMAFVMFPHTFVYFSYLEHESLLEYEKYL